MTIHIVGLGPGDLGHLTIGTRDLLHSGSRVILRTRRHPTVDALDSVRTWTDCDDLYQSGAAFDDIYEAIAQRVVTAAVAGDVVYAVPGHPLFAEASVARIAAAATARGFAVALHPGVSFVDVVATALGTDLGDVQICDAQDGRFDSQRPVLFAQVYDRDVAATLKLRLLDVYPADHEVQVLHALGTAEQGVSALPLSAIDRTAWSYLDSLYVPMLDAEEDVRRFDGLLAIVRRLHALDGCPWDREQTHESLRHHLLEESYEVLEAIDSGDPDALAEELGDLLLQVLMHAAVGERNGTFSYEDVNEGIARKLVRRHPHVFAGAAGDTADEVFANWEKIKKSEKSRDSVLEGVPVSLPALAASQTLQGRARRAGFDWPDTQIPLAKLAEEIEELALAEDASEREAEFGDVAMVLAGIGQRIGIDAEQALRGANQRFRARFGIVERLAAERGIDLVAAGVEEIVALWQEAKQAIASGDEGNPPGVS
ncbi:MAG: nucleoside triphosphate pyrophosphohydrolase [Dehalococcoidia bacterium]